MEYTMIISSPNSHGTDHKNSLHRLLEFDCIGNHITSPQFRHDKLENSHAPCLHPSCIPSHRIWKVKGIREEDIDVGFGRLGLRFDRRAYLFLQLASLKRHCQKENQPLMRDPWSRVSFENCLTDVCSLVAELSRAGITAADTTSAATGIGQRTP